MTDDIETRLPLKGTDEYFIGYPSKQTQDILATARIEPLKNLLMLPNR